MAQRHMAQRHMAQRHMAQRQRTWKTVFVLFGFCSLLAPGAQAAAASDCVATPLPSGEIYIRAAIDIHAPAKKVWGALLNWPAYPSWNPFIRSITGAPTVNGPIQVTIALSPPETISFNAKITRLVEQSELALLGEFMAAGLFNGAYRFALEPLAANKIRFVQEEKFSGLLLPFFMTSQNIENACRGFSQMNQGLRAQAESKRKRR